MFTLQIPPTFKPTQVEIPDGVERSCKGSLHLRPGTKKVTKAEWAHLKKEEPKLVKGFQATEAAEKKPKAADKKPEPKAAPAKKKAADKKPEEADK